MLRRPRYGIVAALLLSVSVIFYTFDLPVRLPVPARPMVDFRGASELAGSRVATRTAGPPPSADRKAADPASGSPSGSPGQQRHQRPLLVLHWTERPKHWLTLHDNSFSGCPVSDCRGTADRSLLPQADVVLFNGARVKLNDLPQKRLPRQKFVFFLRESPQSVHLPAKELDGFFNLTMTYRPDADVLYYWGMTAEGKQEGTPPFFHRRRRPVAWMVSHCKTYSKREQYVSQLQRHIPVDILGGCAPDGRRCAGNRTACYRQLAETHLFYLAFENTICNHYITEKFWMSLMVGMVPVVRGLPPEHYRRVAPPNSFIHVEEFAGPKELAGRLLALAQNRTEYERYHEWRRSHHVQVPLSLPCGLCRRLSRGGRDPAVRMSNTWDEKTQCRAPSDINSN